MENLERIIKAIRVMDTCQRKISETADEVKLGNEGFSVSLITKMVFEEKGKVYRISSLPTTLQRVAMAEYFKSLGCDIFLPEKIIFKTSWCGITEQDKLEEVYKKKEAEALEDICECYPGQAEQIKELFAKYKVKWFNLGNYGVDSEGKIRVFDYIANMNWSTHKNGLTGGDGKVVYQLDT